MTDTTINVGGDNRGEIAGRDINKTIIYKGDQAYDVRGLANPYLGLAAFTYSERDRYAGREDEIEQAVQRLTAPGSQRVLLFVTGASGSGKSSFAQAGLVPALEKHYHEQNFTLRRAVFRPGDSPLAGLTQALRTLNIPVDGIFEPAAVYQLAPSPRPLDANQISVLIIDQFEEVFRPSNANQLETFFQILVDLLPFRESLLHVLVTMRTDYLPDLFAHQALHEIAKIGIELREMSEDELKQAIQRPIHAMHPDAGKRFQSALLNQVAADAAKDSAFLPLLQVTLEELWGNGILTADYYEDLTDAISKRADRIYQYKQTPEGREEVRSQAEQQVLLDSFLDLVAVSLDEEVPRDVRRTRRLHDVTRGSQQAETLIQELATARLLTTDDKDLDGSGQEVETVDIIHESLINNWSRLSNAIEEQRKQLQTRRRFELRLLDWVEDEKRPELLLSGVQLEEAVELKDAGDVAVQPLEARAFVEQSIQERDRIRNRNLRNVTAVAIILALLLGVTSYLGVRFQSASTKAEQEANKNLVQSILFDVLDTDDAELRLRLAMESILVSRDQGVQPLPESLRELLHAYTKAPIQSISTTDDPILNVGDLAFDPSGRWIALQKGSNPGTGRLYDRVNKEIVSLSERFNNVNYFHFLSEENLIIVREWPNIHLLDKDTLALHCSLPSEEKLLYYQTHSTEAMLMVTADGTTLQLWRMFDCTETARVPFDIPSIDLSTGETDLFFNAKQTQLIAILDDALYRWDISSSGLLTAQEPLIADRLIINKEKTKLLLFDSGDFHLLDMENGQIIPTRLDPAKVRGNGILSGDGQRLWSRTSRRPYVLTQWDSIDGTELNKIELETRPDRVTRAVGENEDWLLIWHDQQVRLYSMDSGELFRFLPGYRGAAQVKDAEVNSSGEWLLIELTNHLGQDVIELWAIERNVQMAEYGFGTSFLAPIQFSPDNQLIATLGVDPALETSLLRIWELPDELDVVDIFQEDESIIALAETQADGLWLMNAVNRESLTNAPISAQVVDFPKPSQNFGFVVDHHCNESWSECTLSIWDDLQNASQPLYTHTCRDEGDDEGDEQGVACPLNDDFIELSIDSSGRRIAFRGYYGDGSNESFDGNGVAIWDLAMPARLTYLPHQDFVESVAFSPTEPLLATMDARATVTLWDLNDSTPVSITLSASESGSAPYPIRLAFTLDGKHLIWNTSERGLHLKNIELSDQLINYRPDANNGYAAVIDYILMPDGKRIAMVSQNNLRFVDSTDNEQFEPLPGQQIQFRRLSTLEQTGKVIEMERGSVNDIAFADGDHLEFSPLMAVASSDEIVRIWHIQADNNQLLMEVPHDVSVTRVLFAPDGRHLVTVDVEETLHTWPIDFTDPTNMYGLWPHVCQRLSRDFTDGEWYTYMGEREQREWICDKY
ncbi:MAG: hypothetical protein AAF702_14690 [Chloroflexota bacterium]